MKNRTYHPPRISNHSIPSTILSTTLGADFSYIKQRRHTRDGRPYIAEGKGIGVFVDGACPGNGHSNPRAGMGVYFGPGSKYNICQPLDLDFWRTFSASYSCFPSSGNGVGPGPGFRLRLGNGYYGYGYGYDLGTFQLNPSLSHLHPYPIQNPNPNPNPYSLPLHYPPSTSTSPSYSPSNSYTTPNFLSSNTHTYPSLKITNQKAELISSILALQKIKKLLLKQLLSTTHVTIITDSEYMVKSMTQYVFKWRINDWKNSKGVEVVNKDEMRLLDLLIDELVETWGVYVRFWYVEKGWNGEADELARRAADLVGGGNGSGSTFVGDVGSV